MSVHPEACLDGEWTSWADPERDYDMGRIAAGLGCTIVVHRLSASGGLLDFEEKFAGTADRPGQRVHILHLVDHTHVDALVPITALAAASDSPAGIPSDGQATADATAAAAAASAAAAPAQPRAPASSTRKPAKRARPATPGAAAAVAAAAAAAPAADEDQAASSVPSPARGRAATAKRGRGGKRRRARSQPAGKRGSSVAASVGAQATVSGQAFTVPGERRPPLTPREQRILAAVCMGCDVATTNRDVLALPEAERDPTLRSRGISPGLLDYICDRAPTGLRGFLSELDLVRVLWTNSHAHTSRWSPTTAATPADWWP